MSNAILHIWSLVSKVPIGFFIWAIFVLSIIEYVVWAFSKTHNKSRY